LNVVGSEEVCSAGGFRNEPDKAIDVLLIALEGYIERQHLWRRRSKGGQLARQLVKRQGPRNSRSLVLRYHRRKVALAAESLVDRVGERFGVAERIGDTLRRAGILLIMSIAKKSPSGTVRLAKEVSRGAQIDPIVGSFCTCGSIR